MTESGQYPDATRSVESLREMRLVALLGDLMGEQGKTQAAQTLGVSPRTLTRFEESRRLTPTLAGALERHLLEGGGSAAATQRHRLGMLEDGLKELERALRDGLSELRQEGEAAREEQAGAVAELERRLALLEAAGNGPGAVNSGPPPAGSAAKAQTGSPAPAGTPVARRPRRDYYDLVTVDPEPDEELVYGDAATAVIVQWRQARDAVGHRRDALDRLDARQRLWELEIALIREHELTLPPATYPWDWSDREEQVRRRTQYLDDVRVDRNRLRLRCLLTFGLWRN